MKHDSPKASLNIDVDNLQDGKKSDEKIGTNSRNDCGSLSRFNFIIDCNISAHLMASSLTDPALMSKWTLGSFKVDGDTLSLYSGLIIYKMIKIEGNLILMNWRLNGWNSECESQCAFEITPNGDERCTSTITFSNAPSDFKDVAPDFFNRYYITPISRLFGIF